MVEKGSSKAIADATVTLEGNLLTTHRTMVTNSQGQFSFANLSPGRYTLKASAEGFIAEELILIVAPRATAEIEFELAPKPSMKQEITVTAKLKLLDDAQITPNKRK